MPGAHGIKFVERRSRTCLRHFCQPQVDGVGQDHCQQCRPVLGQRIGAQVRKVPGKVRPLIDLKQQFGNLGARHHAKNVFFKPFRFFRYAFGQWLDL